MIFGVITRYLFQYSYYCTSAKYTKYSPASDQAFLSFFLFFFSSNEDKYHEKKQKKQKQFSRFLPAHGHLQGGRTTQGKQAATDQALPDQLCRPCPPSLQEPTARFPVLVPPFLNVTVCFFIRSFPFFSG